MSEKIVQLNEEVIKGRLNVCFGNRRRHRKHRL